VYCSARVMIHFSTVALYCESASSVLQCVAVCCSVLRCVCCSVRVMIYVSRTALYCEGASIVSTCACVCTREKRVWKS